MKRTSSFVMEGEKGKAERAGVAWPGISEVHLA